MLLFIVMSRQNQTMEALHYLVLLASFLLIIYQLILKKGNVEHKKLLPISPPSLPVIGHFHLLTKISLDQALTNLSTKYGPIFFLRLGSRPALVLSTRSAVEECFAKNDIIFSNRPLLPSRKISNYNFSNLGAPYGDHWRNLRRAFVLEILSPKRLQMSSDIRTEEVRFMIKHLFGSSSGSKGVDQKVDVRTFLYLLDFNIIMRMVAGERCFEEEEVVDMEKAKGKLHDLLEMFSPLMTKALGDYFPFLRWLTHCFGVEKKISEIHEKSDSFLQALLDAHRNNDSVTEADMSRTIVDRMLKLQESEPEFYTDPVIKGIMQAMLLAGTHTTVSTMTLVILRLISHPEVLKTARDEIHNLVGQSRLLNDADLAKIPYLHCIINETLRLDSARFLPERESSEECTVAGYKIPQGTELSVNIWNIHRDPELWAEPDRFMPERFQECELEKGVCKFMAFGVGRRQCPGISLAMRIMTLTLGTLIQCFDWEKAENEPEDRCLKMIFRPREALTEVLAQL